LFFVYVLLSSAAVTIELIGIVRLLLSLIVVRAVVELRLGLGHIVVLHLRLGRAIEQPATTAVLFRSTRIGVAQIGAETGDTDNVARLECVQGSALSRRGRRVLLNTLHYHEMVRRTVLVQVTGNRLRVAVERQAHNTVVELLNGVRCRRIALRMLLHERTKALLLRRRRNTCRRATQSWKLLIKRLRRRLALRWRDVDRTRRHHCGSSSSTRKRNRCDHAGASSSLPAIAASGRHLLAAKSAVRHLIIDVRGLFCSS